MEQELRYERKFYLTNTLLPELMNCIRLHSSLFSEIYHQRQINNIYFDTPGFQSYYDNIDGARERVKARIRWYGNTFGVAKDPILEFKVKKGLMGYKTSIKLNDLNIASSLTKKEIIKHCLSSIQDEKLKNFIRGVHPVLLNVYSRKYFMSANKELRLTVDHNLHYYNFMDNGGLFIAPVKDQNGLVIELKYSKSAEEQAKQMMKEFPYIMTKNSKYLQGLTRILGLEL